MRYLVKSVTAVLFASYDLTNKLDVAHSLNKKVKHIFDGEPIFFPIPNDAPPEIPRIIFASKDQRYRCNIAAGRLGFLYTQAGEPDKELNDLRDEYLTILRQIAEVIKGEWKADVFRLGFVVESLVFHDDPVELIKDAFIREGALKTPHQLEMHVLDRMTWENLEVNRWYRLSSTIVSAATGERKALSVIFDINTILEKRYDFSTDSMIAFCERAITYISNNLKILFPASK